MNHDDLNCGVCENMAEAWNGIPCPCHHGCVWTLTWGRDFCVVWIGDALLGFPKEESYVGNPLQCDHTHHIQTPNVGAISCYMTMFLALKTSILIIWHHVDCTWWTDGGSQLLYSIKHFNFGYCVAEHLWSLLIYAGGQTVSILQALDEYPDCNCIICKVTPFSFCPEPMYICCKGLLNAGSPWITRCMCGYLHCKASVLTDLLFHPLTYLKWWPLWLVCASNLLILPWWALFCSHWWGLLPSQCQGANLPTW